MNLSFLNLIRKACNKKNWIKLEKGLNKAVTMAIQVHHNGIAPEIQPETDEDEDEDDDNDNLEVDAEERQDRKGKKKQRKMSHTDTAKNDKLIKLSHQWTEFSNEVLRFSKKRSQIEQSFVFSFEEGALVKAVSKIIFSFFFRIFKYLTVTDKLQFLFSSSNFIFFKLRIGQWVLLDEINLASPETLQRISSLLDGTRGTLVLTENGELTPIQRHPSFRLFAAMNPATDVGKRDLPPALRTRLTEMYVDELTDEKDLEIVTKRYLNGIERPPVRYVSKIQN